MTNSDVVIVMGSQSDLTTMSAAADVLDELGVSHQVRIISAHRTPTDMIAFGSNATEAGIQVIIAGAGGAAHLPGMLAATTTLPVIGVPVPLKHLDGLDSLLSIIQMPTGTPVATVAIGNAANAGLLAARIIALQNPSVRAALEVYRQRLAERSRATDTALSEGS